MYDWDNDGYISEYDDMITNIILEDDDDCNFNNDDLHSKKSQTSLSSLFFKELAVVLVIITISKFIERYVMPNCNSIISNLKNIFF